MVVIGLVLVGLAIAAGVDVAAQNHVQALQIHAAGNTFSVTPGGMVAFGAVCALVCTLGIMLMHQGAVRSRRLRLEAGAARSQRHELEAQVARERRARLDAEQGQTEAPGAVSGAAQGDMLDSSDGAGVMTPSRRGWMHRAARERRSSSPSGEFGEPPLEEPPLRAVLGERQGTLVRSAGLRSAAEAAQQLGPRRVEVPVVVEAQPLDDGEAGARAFRLSDGDRPVELDHR